MRAHMRFGSIAAMAAALVLAGCAAIGTQKSTGEFVDDAGITSRVKVALAEDPVVKARQVNVETFRGVVQLNGFVDSAEAKSQATTVAQNVEGVQDVENNLEVHTQARSVGTFIDDATITAKVKTALVGNSTTEATEVKVDTRDGVVQLSGYVDDEAEKQAAGQVAQNVAGVQRVENEIEVRPDAE
jgi:hyperosmotically inducible periplasmic protein